MGTTTATATSNVPDIVGLPTAAILEKSSDAIVVVDLESGCVVWVNAMLESLCGRVVDEIVGHPASILAANADAGATTFGPNIYRNPGLYEEVALAAPDRFAANVTMYVSHTPTQAPTHAICLARDETERRLVERELITKHLALVDAHRELEQRVTELRTLSEDLAARRQDIARLSARIVIASRRAMLAEVIAEVAHSLNNPLAALLSSLRMLHKLGLLLPTDDAKERHTMLAARCSEAGERMRQVVDDLRHACRHGTTKTNAERIDVAHEIESAAALLAHAIAPGVVFELAVEPGLEAHARRDEIHHALLNVLTNALQAVGPDGRIRVTTLRNGPWTEIHVADSGPGIAPDLLAEIFEPFFTTRADGEGTGLGLSMVRRTVLRWGGTVDVVAHGELGGATFRIKLPAEGSR